ncbi:hypothetical protein OIV83_000294 [Microbotryomycetes sp. JL201]|nr:hypothetical protein OIV83_000294 [Microbotryomycetes sp. JL201]
MPPSEMRATLDSLPAELIAEILEQVDLLNAAEPCVHQQAAAAAMAHGPGGGQDDGHAPQNTLLDAFNLFFGAAFDPPPAAAGPQARAGPAGAQQERTDPANMTRNNVNGTAAASNVTRAPQTSANGPVTNATSPRAADSAIPAPEGPTAGAARQAAPFAAQRSNVADDDGYSWLSEDGETWTEYQNELEDALWPRKTFPDGLPSDPILPLASVNRAFLAASRHKLYKSVNLLSVWQASLFLESVTASEHAAFSVEDDCFLPEDCTNILQQLVKTLRIDLAPGKDLSLRRGGGQTVLDILKACPNLESLTLNVSFLGSATGAYLRTLTTLQHLKSVKLCGGVSKDGLRLTTARLLHLLRFEWLNLENLVVDSLDSNALAPENEALFMMEDAENRVGATNISTIRLINPRVDPFELDCLLEEARFTLTCFELVDPGPLSTPRTLAQSLLSYGYNLTTLHLDLSRNWGKDPVSIVPPLPAGTAAPKVTPRKDYKQGRPTQQDTVRIAQQKYFLEGLLPYLPHLEELEWFGPIASAQVFKSMQPALKRVRWSRCPTLKPATAAKVLMKHANVWVPEGDEALAKASKKAAVGLKCMTVSVGRLSDRLPMEDAWLTLAFRQSDDLRWSDEELAALRDAAKARDCCLHTSESTYSNGLFGGFTIPLDLGPVPVPVTRQAGARARNAGEATEADDAAAAALAPLNVNNGAANMNDTDTVGPRTAGPTMRSVPTQGETSERSNDAGNNRRDGGASNRRGSRRAQTDSVTGTAESNISAQDRRRGGGAGRRNNQNGTGRDDRGGSNRNDRSSRNTNDSNSRKETGGRGRNRRGRADSSNADTSLRSGNQGDRVRGTTSATPSGPSRSRTTRRGRDAASAVSAATTPNLAQLDLNAGNVIVCTMNSSRTTVIDEQDDPVPSAVPAATHTAIPAGSGHAHAASTTAADNDDELPPLLPPPVNQSTRPSIADGWTVGSQRPTRASMATGPSQQTSSNSSSQTPTATSSAALITSLATQPPPPPSDIIEVAPGDSHAAQCTGPTRPLSSYPGLEGITNLTEAFGVHVPESMPPSLRQSLETVLRTMVLRVDENSSADVVHTALEPILRQTGEPGSDVVPEEINEQVQETGRTAATPVLEAGAASPTSSPAASMTPAAPIAGAVSTTSAGASAASLATSPSTSTIPAISATVASPTLPTLSTSPEASRTSSAAPLSPTGATSSPSAASPPSTSPRPRTPRSTGTGRRTRGGGFTGASAAARRTGRPWTAVMGDLSDH